MHISEYQKTSNFMGLFVGRPGSGKSVGAASFPKPMYIAEIGGRIKPVVEFFGDENIEFDSYLEGDFPKLHTKLNELVRNPVNKKGEPLQTLVIDGWTGLADMLLTYSMDNRGRDGSQKGLLRMLEVEDFNAETQGLTNLILMFSLMKNIPFKIMTAHLLITEHYNILTNKNELHKSILTAGKKVTEKIPAKFDEVWMFFTKDEMVVGKEPRRLVRTIRQGDDFVKHAINVPPEIEFTKGPNNPKGSLFKQIEHLFKG